MDEQLTKADPGYVPTGDGQAMGDGQGMGKLHADVEMAAHVRTSGNGIGRHRSSGEIKVTMQDAK